ncbi:MAG: tetratricopeptide repeat protein [Chloroflexota bacterium]|nr:MAG: tetratricopeptide repeat protein [Chloroflexota bacterium]
METALGLSGQPVKRGTMAHDHNVYMVLTDNAAQRGDLEALRQYTPLLEELAIRDDHILFRAIAHRAWGAAHHLEGDNVKAVGRLGEALDLFTRLNTPWQMGRTLSEMAEVELAQSRPAEAKEYLSRALAAFEAVKAGPDIKRIQEKLEAVTRQIGE